ncbi:MAG: glycosyltransferase family 4 protein [Oscillospiraceae bacterium]
MKKKLCFVIQRYGSEILGGAEGYTKTYVEHLKDIFDIEIATTTALDYSTWGNYYPAGKSVVDGITVHRFPVKAEKNMQDFTKLCNEVLTKASDISLEKSYNWVTEQGPFCPDLPEFLSENCDKFDLFIFFTYLYYPAVFGIKEVAEKSILVPFCHDEAPVYLECFQGLFQAAKGIIYNTEEERDFAQRHFSIEKTPSILTGIGLDIPPIDGVSDVRQKFNLTKPYMIYMGRIDTGKGCNELFKYFENYKNSHNIDLDLVLIGNEVMEIPVRDDVFSLGFVSDNDKYSLLKYAELLVLPSHFESLSIVVLEAFAFKKPVLVSGHCAVLKGHCTKSNGGLYFYGSEDFADCLDLLIENPNLRDAMGKNGDNYVNERYQWDIILKKMSEFVEKMCEI